MAKQERIRLIYTWTKDNLYGIYLKEGEQLYIKKLFLQRNSFFYPKATSRIIMIENPIKVKSAIKSFF